MDAALAAPGHGWPMAACPRSVAEVREPDEVGPNREEDLLVTFGAPLPKVTRRKGGTDISTTQIKDIHTIPVHPKHRIVRMRPRPSLPPIAPTGDRVTHR